MTKLRYIAEAAILYLFYGLCRILPPAWASNMGGFIARNIGPRLAASRKAMRNIALALPYKDAAQRDKIIHDMWDNLGRVAAEYPHLKTLGHERTKMIVDPAADKAVRRGEAVIFFSIHASNWEMLSSALLGYFDRPVHATYRAPNNPYSGKLINNARLFDPRTKAFPKARASGRKLMKAMKDKETLGMLIDQKYNEGIAVPFFGHEATTNPIHVQLAQKYGAHLIPVSNKRTGAARFEITVHAPLELTDNNGNLLPVETILNANHAMIEEWIKDDPGSWIWLHKRWPQKAFKGLKDEKNEQ